MKKQIVFLLLLAAPLLLSAQRYPTGKGTLRSGGGFNFGFANETDERIYRFNITPRLGYFVTDRFMAGFITNYTLQVGTVNTLISSLKFTPEVKYYLPLSTHFFLLGTLQYTIDRRSDYTKTKTITDNSTVAFGPGVTYFFSRRIGFECNILYTQYLHPEGVINKVTTDFGFIFHILDKHGKFIPFRGDKNDYEKELDEKDIDEMEIDDEY